MPRLTAEWTGDIDDVRRMASGDAGEFDADFARRFAEHFPTLHPLFVQLYGQRDDGLEQLAAVIAEAAASWRARPLELKARDDLRELRTEVQDGDGLRHERRGKRETTRKRPSRRKCDYAERG